MRLGSSPWLPATAAAYGPDPLPVLDSPCRPRRSPPSRLLCAVLIVLLRPLLVRYALARPNARSSHAVPTPQGGGIAVVAATLLVAALGLALPAAAAGDAAR